MFSAALNATLHKLIMHPHNFKTHSFRIGVATSTKQAGINDSHIKKLWVGREAMPNLKQGHSNLLTTYQARINPEH